MRKEPAPAAPFARALLAALVLCSAAAPATMPVHRTSTERVALPGGGAWTRIDAARTDRPTVPGLVRPIRQPCRPGTTGYPPPNDRFDCLGFYRDNANAGHPVLLRRGASGATGFGYLHALIDHGLDENSIATIIVNSAAGQIQDNGRFLYGMRYEVDGVGIVAVEVYEQRQPPDDFVDGDGLGVVTAFCVGFDGLCPEGVNESLAQ